MPTVVITGAGSGLGRELALQWDQKGWRVIATDRHLGSARETVGLLKNGQPHAAYALDVSQDAPFDQLLDALSDTPIDMLVNNAGVATAGTLTNTPLSEWDRVIDVNLMGVVRGCRAFASRLKSGGGGHVVNIASFAGLANAPAMATYNVTKAGVISLSETLRTEWQRDNIGVTVVCPSFFQTGLLEHAESFGVDIQRIGGKLMEQSPITATDVARSIIASVESGQFLCIPHRDARWQYRLKRFAPESFARMMINRARAMLRSSPPAPGNVPSQESSTGS
ncbi:MAG: SDR family NAD(P)-dependent oxidoreductase [Pseudomonadota bacterium]